jgi:hypothetical protein
MKKPMLHFQLEKLLESFRQVVNPTSKKPATTRISHAMKKELNDKGQR